MSTTNRAPFWTITERHGDVRVIPFVIKGGEHRTIAVDRNGHAINAYKLDALMADIENVKPLTAVGQFKLEHVGGGFYRSVDELGVGAFTPAWKSQFSPPEPVTDASAWMCMVRDQQGLFHRVDNQYVVLDKETGAFSISHDAVIVIGSAQIPLKDFGDTVDVVFHDGGAAMKRKEACKPAPWYQKFNRRKS